MSKSFSFSIFILLFFLNVSNLKAQTIQKEKQPLAFILKALENRYNISFSYVDKTIKSKEIIPLDEDVTLQQALEFLKIETNLDYELLDNRFVAIKPLKKEVGLKRTQYLKEVIVNNYLTSGITKLNDGSLKIKPETFGILPGLIEPDVLQTIQALPGVLSTDETVSNINVRGGTHDQNLLLWDGIKMYQSGHFFGLISAFSPFLTKEINIYKNGTRAKYGDGISSIIDMQLPDTIDNELNAGVGFNLINADIYAKIPITENTELQLSTRRSVTDLITTPTYDQYFKRIFQDSDLINQKETFSFYDITAKFLYDVTKKDKLRFHFLTVNNNLNYEEQAIINNRSEALNSELNQQNLALGATYIRNWNKDLTTTAQVYISNYDLDATNYDIINDQRLIQENEVYDGSAKFDIDYTLNINFKINGGYQFSEIGISNLEDVNNPIFRSYIKNVIRSHAIYAETNFLSNSAKTRLVLGGRLNHIPKFDMFFAEPRLSFSQRFLHHFRFEVLGEFKNQTTSQIIDLQNDFLGIEKRRWVLSNNNKEATSINNKTIFPVPVLKSKQISAGIHYSKNDLLISVESYIKKVDGVSTRSQGFQNQYQFVNSIGSYEIKGVDFILNKQLNDIVSTWASYSYSTNNYTFPDLNSGKSFPNNADIRHAFTFAGTYTQNKIKLALGLNWHSGKPTTPPTPINPDQNVNNTRIDYDNPNSKNLKDYLRTDFSTTYNFNISKTTNASIGASVWNLLDKKNIINEYYTRTENNEITKVELQSLGITPNVSFRVYF